MIRFPERSHASTTPGARSGPQHVEPNYQENEPRPSDRAPVRQNASASGARQPPFDFAAIEAALGAGRAK